MFSTWGLVGFKEDGTPIDPDHLLYDKIITYDANAVAQEGLTGSWEIMTWERQFELMQHSFKTVFGEDLPNGPCTTTDEDW
jgi:hypothetical protein